jgi:imidazolonepropionase-like amidohydrolase
MSETNKIIETELAPHIDIHSPPTVAGLRKLVAAVRLEAITEAIEASARIAEKGYYMDDGGSSPMRPEMIAKRIREDAGIEFGYQRENGTLAPIPESDPSPDTLKEVDDLLNNLID